VKSCRSTRETTKGISPVRSARGCQAQSARTSPSWTRLRRGCGGATRGPRGSRPAAGRPRRALPLQRRQRVELAGPARARSKVRGLQGIVHAASSYADGLADQGTRRVPPPPPGGSYRPRRRRYEGGAAAGARGATHAAVGALPAVAGAAHRLLPAHHGLRRLEGGHRRAGRPASSLLPRNPFEGGFAVAAGLEHAVDYVAHHRFERADLDWLGGQAGSDGRALFEPPSSTSCRAAARVRRGRRAGGNGRLPARAAAPGAGAGHPLHAAGIAAAHPARFQTLVPPRRPGYAWRPAAIRWSKFGLRRAQGIDGGLAASRAAFIGGCAGTSNVLAGRLLRHPGPGHPRPQLVIALRRRRARVLPGLRPGHAVELRAAGGHLPLAPGVRKAIEAARALRAQGASSPGSGSTPGDLAWLSVQAPAHARRGGFPAPPSSPPTSSTSHIIRASRTREPPWGCGGWGRGW